MVDPDVPFVFCHSAMDLQAVEVKVAVGNIKGERTILLLVPNFFHAKNKPVKSRQATIIVSTGRHVSNCVHDLLLGVRCIAAAIINPNETLRQFQQWLIARSATSPALCL